jgi:hypothetical protein
LSRFKSFPLQHAEAQSTKWNPAGRKYAAFYTPEG